MAKRREDEVMIESVVDADFSLVIDRATQYEIATSILQPSYARFEIGDESTWGPLREYLRIGGRFAVSINGQRRVTGRMLTRNLPITPEAGATMQVMFRTILADAAFTVCTPGLKVRALTLEALVLSAFERLGLTKDDFIFRGDFARDTLTGRRSGQPSAAAGIRARIAKLDNERVSDEQTAGQIIRQKRLLTQQLQGAETRPVVPGLQEITVQAADVQPGETVWSFVDRHLRRYGMMMWDAPDGRIIVGHPDDSQLPLYIMSCQKGQFAQANNIERATKTEDYEQVPSVIWVYGRDGGKGYAVSSSVKASERDSVLGSVDPRVDRIQMVFDPSIRTQALAEARARQEMLQRSLMKDAWQLETDGLSYWTGRESLPYLIDTVADLRIDVADRADGPYLLHECIFTGDGNGGHSTKIGAVAKGVWVL